MGDLQSFRCRDILCFKVSLIWIRNRTASEGADFDFELVRGAANLSAVPDGKHVLGEQG